MTHAEMSEQFLLWMAALEARHLSELRVADVTRALRALSAQYVERRRSLTSGFGKRQIANPLGSAGKRVAFALFYAPLHFLTTAHIVRALGADAPGMVGLLDIGCGTGAAGAAWALAAGSESISGLDRHPWAVREAAWTYKQFGLRANTTLGDLTRLPRPRPHRGALAAYVLNELSGASRMHLERRLHEIAARGSRVLVIEPIARPLTPWWDAAARKAEEAGGHVGEWRFTATLPPLVRLLDKAAGMDHTVLTARSLYLPGNGGQQPARASGKP